MRGRNVDNGSGPHVMYRPLVRRRPPCWRGRGRAMYSASDLRKGLKVEIEGQPYVITEFNFVKPGKGQALYNCKLKGLITGGTLTKTYRANDRIDQPKLEEKTLQYSYQDGENYVFLDSEFEQVSLPAEVLGDAKYFLVEDIAVDVLYYNDRPIEVTLPTFVEKEIVETEPGARGDTATNVLKPARIAGGYEIQVPLFVNQGDIVRIDTRTGTYADRVRR
jgi:elongation factor P